MSRAATLEHLQETLAKLMRKRDQLVSALANNEGDVRYTRSAIKRKLRNIERNHLVPFVAALRDGRDAPPPPPPADDLTIPDFLKRDVVARMTIEAANAERKRTKAQVRIEKLKAKQSGETRKVPLTGKDALRFIREGK